MRGWRIFLLFVFVALLFVLMLKNATLAMSGVRHALTLCTQTLIPALFPFLVIAELVIATGFGECLGRLLGGPVAVLLGLSREGACAVLLGSVCGEPLACVSARAMWERGDLSKEEVVRISLFANNPSSAFLTVAVGGALFGNTSAGSAR